MDPKNFLGENYIDHLTGAPRCPYTNGQGERSVRVLKDLLKKNTVGSLDTRLCNVLLYYRNTPHSVTKIAPSVALNSRRYVTLRESCVPCGQIYIDALNVGLLVSLSLTSPCLEIRSANYIVV